MAATSSGLTVVRWGVPGDHGFFDMEIPGKTLVPNQNGPKFAPKRTNSDRLEKSTKKQFSGVKFDVCFREGIVWSFKNSTYPNTFFQRSKSFPVAGCKPEKFSPKTLVFRGKETSLERRPSKRLPKLPVRNPKQNMASRSDMTQTNLGLRPTQCPQTVEKMCTERCKCSTWTFQFV